MSESTAKLTRKLSHLQNTVALLEMENASLRSLCDDTYGLVIAHHASGRMVQLVCEPCSDIKGRMIMDRLATVRQQENQKRCYAETGDTVYLK